MLLFRFPAFLPLLVMRHLRKQFISELFSRCLQMFQFTAFRLSEPSNWLFSIDHYLSLLASNHLINEVLFDPEHTCDLEQLDTTPKASGREKGLFGGFGEVGALVTRRSSTEDRSSGRSLKIKVRIRQILFVGTICYFASMFFA